MHKVRGLWLWETGKLVTVTIQRLGVNAREKQGSVYSTWEPKAPLVRGKKPGSGAGPPCGLKTRKMEELQE